MPPLAAGAHDVEQAVQHAPHVGGARPTAGFGRRDQRFEQTELIIAERLAGPKVPNQSAIRACPHRRPPDGKIPFRTANGANHHRRLYSVARLSKRAVRDMPKDAPQLENTGSNLMIVIAQEVCPAILDP